MLQGLFAPLPTPFGQDGRLDLGALQALARAIIPELDGLLILGSNGETPYLSEEERGLALRAAREVIPASKVMLAGVGAETPAGTIERCRVAADAGADVLLVLPPHYYRSAATPAMLEGHFRLVAASSPLPLAAYNNPAVCGFSFAPASLAKLAREGVIVAVKDSSGDIGALYATLREAPPEFSVLGGHAPTYLAALAGGASGGVLAVANLMPRSLQALCRAVQAGDLKEARRLQHRCAPLAEAVSSRYGVPGLKAALRLRGLPGGYPRAPLADAAPEAVAELRRLLDDVSDEAPAAG